MRSRIASPSVGIADHLVPSTDRDLAGDQQRASVVAIIDDLEQIAALLGIERLRPPVVDDQSRVRSSVAIKRGSRPSPRAWARSANRRLAALVEHGEALAAGLVAEGASQPRLADAGRPDDRQMMVVADPLAGGELLEQGAIEAARRAQVDVLDDRGLAQPGRRAAGA